MCTCSASISEVSVRAWFVIVLLVSSSLLAGCGSVSVSSGGAGAAATTPLAQVSAGVSASGGLAASPGSVAGSPASSANPDDADGSDQPSTSAQIGGSGVLSDGSTPTSIAAVDM